MSAPLELDLSASFRRAEGGRRLVREATYLEPALPADIFVRTDPSPGPSGSTSGSVGSLSMHTVPGVGRVSSSEPDLPELGAVIDKYRIEKLIGVGGFGVVYQATHLLLNTPVAIKMLRPSVLKRRPELAALLCEEAQVAARINHPNVVRVNDVTHTSHITYVVIEFVDGGSLAERLHRTRRLPLRVALRIGVDVALGLKAGLAVGITHRDIKPANILLTHAGQAKVADLGLARVHGLSSSLLGSSTVVGTPGFMAPEQIVDAQQVDFRADMYSLGVSLYQATVGELPFSTRDRHRLQSLHRTAAPPPPSSRVPGFHPAVEALLLRLLAKSPEQRFDSYDALLASLHDTLAALPSAAPTG